MKPSQTFSSETTLNTQENQLFLENFWQSVTKGTLVGKDNVKLAWCAAINPDSDKAIVICNGRIESYLKYIELINDLYQQGYSVYAIDHRGQGLSDRLTKNPQMGHVDKFSDYVDDFATFIEKVVKPAGHKTLFLVGHSMGGAISTLYLDRYPQTFSAAALSAPMYGIKLPVSKVIIRILAQILDSAKNGREPNYVLGGKDYRCISFAKNELTNSQQRYDCYRTLYQSKPNIQLGAPTNHWLVESLAASELAITAAKQSQIPILIFQGENDTVVDNSAHDKALSTNCQKIVIPGAKHEIYIETDTRRNMALNAMMAFFNNTDNKLT